MFDFYSIGNTLGAENILLNTQLGNLKDQFTPGYKSETVNFTDYMSYSLAGQGAKYKTGGIVFSQGPIYETKNEPLNVAIQGSGFVVLSDGQNLHYTRDGRLSFNKDGNLTHPTGLKVVGYQLDENGSPSGNPGPINLALDPESKLYGGKYTGYYFDEGGKLYGECTEINPITKQAVKTKMPIYQLAIGSFANPSALNKSSTTTFIETENSGQAVMGISGQGALGRVVPGHLEGSNVDFVQTNTDINQTKIVYDSNFSVLKAMDKMTESAIQIIK
ncbi:MAG: flagellar hook basal-body protein [Armatimonadetes bacterium]|nr:flagellar hook basal-body protein [Armatimonadota bacterium]